MSNYLLKTGDFTNSLNLQFLGSINTYNSNSYNVQFKCWQNVFTDTTKKLNLKVWQGHTDFREFNVGTPNYTNNINDMTLLYNIQVNVSQIGSIYNSLNKIFNCKGSYIIFQLVNTSQLNDMYYSLKSSVNNIPVDNYEVNDQLIDNVDKGLLVKVINDYKINVQEKRHTDIETWQMTANGSLGTTEYLLYDDGIQTNGYFHSGETHSGANSLSVQSSSAQDMVGALGAHKIEIDYLDNAFDRKTHIQILNGQTQILCGIQASEVNSAKIIETNANGIYTNAGTISLYNVLATDLSCIIPIEMGISHNPQYCVPNAYVLLIDKITIASKCEDESELYINTHTWNQDSNGTNQLVKHSLKKFQLKSTQDFESTVNLTITAKQRLTITGKTKIAPTGINKINIQLFGYLKKVNLIDSSNNKFNEN